MLKREITYEDFEGNEVTDIYYFNISKPELVELEVNYEGGFSRMLERMIEAKDSKQLITQFKELVLLAYGEKSEDGKHFLKSPEVDKKFSQSAAYNALYMELVTDDNAAAIFLRSVLPKDLVGALDAEEKKAPLAQVAPAPPAPPST